MSHSISPGDMTSSKLYFSVGMLTFKPARYGTNSGSKGRSIFFPNGRYPRSTMSQKAAEPDVSATKCMRAYGVGFSTM